MKTTEHMSTVRGSIESIDPGSHNITVHGLVLNKTFHVADDAEIRMNSKPKADLGEIKVGDMVEVGYEEQGNISIARRIADNGKPAPGGAQRKNG